MFEGAKEKLKVPLQVPTPEKLLSNMTLEKTPEILRLFGRILNLTDKNIGVSEIKDREGNVYRFTLVKQAGLSRCLLKIPIEISTILGGNRGRVFDVLERIKNGIMLKFINDTSISLIELL